MAIYEFKGKRPRVDATAYIHPQATLIGEVIVGPGCYVGPHASLRGDFGLILMEEGSNVQDNCTLHVGVGETCRLGPRSHVGHGAVVHGANLVGNNLIGMNAVVMDQAEIGQDSIVAACAFVKTGLVVPARVLVAGMPASVKRPLGERDLAWKVEGTAYYLQLAVDSLASLRPIDLESVLVRQV